MADRFFFKAVNSLSLLSTLTVNLLLRVIFTERFISKNSWINFSKSVEFKGDILYQENNVIHNKIKWSKHLVFHIHKVKMSKIC